MQISITLVLVAANVLLSLAALNNSDLLNKLMFNPYMVLKRKQGYRVLSHAFIHVDYIHLFFNMYVLWSFGGLLEQIFTDPRTFASLFPTLEFWGTSRGYLYYFLLYFGGILAATLPAFAKHADNPGYNSLGASGAVSAVVLAIILLLPTMNLRLFFVPIDIPAFILGVAYLIFEYVMSKKGRTGIAHDAHFWGAIYGLALLLILKPGFGLYFLDKVGQFFGIV